MLTAGHKELAKAYWISAAVLRKRSGSTPIIRNAKFRILPPQPASPVSTGLHAKGCQNRANRGISGLCVGLRVPNLSVEVQISLIVSGAVFRCLVFAGAQGPINLCSNRRGGALENMPMARKNAIVHVNDKMQRVLVMLHRGGQLAQPTIGIADVVLDIGVAWVA